MTPNPRSSAATRKETPNPKITILAEVNPPFRNAVRWKRFGGGSKPNNNARRAHWATDSVQAVK